MTIQAIVLDADGVVVAASASQFDEHLHRSHGIAPAITREFFQGVFQDCLIGKADLRKVLPPFLQESRLARSLDDFLNEWFELQSTVDHAVIQIVRQLRESGVRCFLASNQERHRAEYLTNEMHLSEVFDKLFFSHSLGRMKPDHRFYRSIEQSIGLDGRDILFWDDTAGHVAAARECGWNAEVYRAAKDFEQTLAAYFL